MSSPPIPRDSFDLEGAPLWLMHCAEGPVPERAIAASSRFLERERKPWTLRIEEEFLGLPRRVREEGARLLGCAPADLALVATTSAGLITVAQGLEWQEGDEVVTPLGEFPANAWPWKVLGRRGVSLREAPLWEGQRAGSDALASTPPDASAEPERALLDALGPRTRVLAVSWVRFQDGLRLDLERLAEGARARGVPLVVDGIQGAGTLPIELARLEGVAAFASGAHKGLLAPQGLGLFHSAPWFREQLTPPGGWLSVEDAFDFSRPSTDLERDFVPEAERFELGVPNLLGAAALAESLALLNEAGMARIEAHVSSLQRALVDGLASEGAWRAEAARAQGLLEAQRLGSILALHHGERGTEGLDALLARGRERGLLASAREGYLRIAFHGWHDEGDVERVVRWLVEEA